MNVADIRKNVVLHLVIQTACVPIYDLVICWKVNRGKKLVDGPGVFHGSSIVG